MKPNCFEQVFFLASILVFLAPSLHAALSEGAIEQTKKLMKNVCKGKSKVSDEEINLTRSGLFSDNRNLHCYMQCALNMMKVMKKSQMDPEGAMKQLNSLMPDKYRIPMSEQLQKCKDVSGSDGCEVALNFVKCSYEVNPNVSVIPN